MTFTMQSIREMETWSDVELIAYGRACVKYSEQVAAFKSRLQKPETLKQPHCGMPNFKSIFADELKKVSARGGKKAKVTAAAN